MAAKYNEIQEFLRARADHIDCRIQEIVDKNEKEAIARDILNGLPEWFGMSDSTEEYIKDSQDKPFIACFIGDEAVSFNTLCYDVERCRERRVLNRTNKNSHWDSCLSRGCYR